MVSQLIKGATPSELKAAGLDSHYAEHKNSLFPTDANGVPFTAAYFASTGDPLADLTEDMAAEEKARATYENLRQREIVHYTRFKQLFDEYKNKKM